MGAGSSGGGGAKSSTPAAGTGAGASATTGAVSTPAASSGLGAAQSTPISAIPNAGGITSGSTPVSGIQRPGAQEIVGQISPTTTPESSQAVVPSAISNAQATEAANVGNNPVQGAVDYMAKAYTGGLVGAGAGNTTQSALPALGQMSGQQAQSIAVPSSAPGITSTSPIGAVPTSPKGPGAVSRAGSSILEAVGLKDITPEQRQAMFRDSIVQLAQQGKSNTSQSELPRTQSLQEILAALGVRQMADGGKLEAGEQAVVGEAGPELAEGQAGGGATITPLSTTTTTAPSARQRQLAQFPADQPAGGLERFVNTLQDVLIFTAGLQNPSIFANARTAQAEQEAKLAELGIKNPVLLETSPGVARAATRRVGQAGAEAVLRQPEIAERGRFEAIGAVPVGTEPGQTLTPEQRREAVRKARGLGAGVKFGAKGTEIDFPAIPKKDVDTAKIYSKFHGLVAGGAPPVKAAQQIIADADAEGMLVPEPLLDMSNADNVRDIKTALAAAEADARAQVELYYAPQMSEARVTGERTGQIAKPLKPEELAAAKTQNRFIARQEIEDMISAGELDPKQRQQAYRQRELQLNYPLDTQEFYGSKLGGPVQPTPEGARDTLTQNFSASQNLDRLVTKIEPAALGPLRGRYGTMKDFLGSLGAKEAAFRSEIESFRRAYVFAISGKQTNEFEQRRLDRMLNVNQSPTQFGEAMKVLASELDTKYAADANTLLANNERVPPQFTGQFFNRLIGREEPQAVGGPETAAPPTTTGTTGTTTPTLGPGTRSRATTAQARGEVGATMKNYKAQLDAEVKAKRMTPAQAVAEFNRVEAAGVLQP